MGHYWSKLEHGDVVDIIAPGMKPSSETLRAIPEVLMKWGLKARISKNILGPDLLCSNKENFRFQDLKKALFAEDSKMIWCVRGGYGSIHLLKHLSKIQKPKKIKIFMGLSDITTLHTHFSQNWGWPTIHGCNIDRLALDKTTRIENKRIKDLLFGQVRELHYKLKPLNPSARVTKKIKTSIVGGNLITLQSGLGTIHQIDLHKKILFLEDIGERAYRIDRVLTHMDQIGLFKGVSGVIFGQFTGSLEPSGRNLVPKLLAQFAGDKNFPVFSGLSVGHGDNQHPLPLGTKVELNCGARPFVKIQTGCQ